MSDANSQRVDVAKCPEPRGISMPLMVGLIAAPTLFIWFMLRRGYARSTRTAAFTYAAVMFGFGLIGAVR